MSWTVITEHENGRTATKQFVHKEKALEYFEKRMKLPSIIWGEMREGIYDT